MNENDSSAKVLDYGVMVQVVFDNMVVSITEEHRSELYEISASFVRSVRDLFGTYGCKIIAVEKVDHEITVLTNGL